FFKNVFFSLENTKDILVIYEQEAEEWALYLKSLFGHVVNEGGILLYNLKTSSFKDQELFTLPCYKCKLLILSCGLLNCLNRKRSFFLEQVLKPSDNVVILLCGVENSEILYEIVTLDEGSKEISTDQEPEEYLSVVAGIIQPDHQTNSDVNLSDIRGASEKRDLSSITEVLSETLETNEQSILVLPGRISCENPGEIFILLKDEIDDETLEIEFIADNQRIRTQPSSWNKNVKYMKALDFPAGLVYVNVYCGGDIKATAQIEYYTSLEEIEHIFKKVADPITLKFSSVEKLDNVLTLLLKSKISAYEFSPFQSEEDHLEEFPTLLHCAARFGLRKLATLLLNCPEAMRACKITNKYGDDPASIAEKHGHRDLRKLIRELSVNQYGIGSRCPQEAEVDDDKEDDVEDSREETEHEDQEEDDSYSFCNSPDSLYASIPDDLEENRRDHLFCKRPPPPPPRNLPGILRQDNLHSLSQERKFVENRIERECGDGLITACYRQDQDTCEGDGEEEHLYTFAKLDESVYDFILAEEEEEKRKERRSFIMNRPPAPAPRPICSLVREENTPYIVQVFQQKATRVPNENNRTYSPPDTGTDSSVKHNISAEQEELIHLQEQVKKGIISVDEALDRFKQWQNEKQRLQSTQQVRLCHHSETLNSKSARVPSSPAGHPQHWLFGSSARAWWLPPSKSVCTQVGIVGTALSAWGVTCGGR
uniref:B-cell scaffold protein with ankyrin repeats n=1 Tax=Athene cunicularia TaxID=194338 RepID=A0A663MVF1_ATHCN